MEKNQQLAVSQMRKSVELLGRSSTENYSDETMLRFLIVKSMEPEKAAKMFVEWQKWRSSFVPLGFIPDSEVSKELAITCVYLQGLSKHGFPVLLAKSNQHHPAKDQVQFKKFVVYILDKTIASSFKGKEIGNEKVIAVIDLKGISYKNVDPRGFISSFQLQKAYYPERLAKLYFLHMPGLFASAWRMIRRFLDKETLEKIVVVRSENERKEFIKEIGEEILPEEFGGRSKLIPIQDVTISHQY